jgi:hypothetical protein
MSRQLTNVSEQFGTLAGDPYSAPVPGDTDDTTAALPVNTFEALYQAWTARLGYVQEAGKRDIRVALSRREEESLTGEANGDQAFTALEGSWYRIVSNKTGIRLWAIFTERTFERYADRRDLDTEIGLELARPIYTRGFRWALTLSHYERNSTDPTAEYTENRIGALLRYSKFIFQPRRIEGDPAGF